MLSHDYNLLTTLMTKVTRYYRRLKGWYGDGLVTTLTTIGDGLVVTQVTTLMTRCPKQDWKQPFNCLFDEMVMTHKCLKVWWKYLMTFKAFHSKIHTFGFGGKPRMDKITPEDWVSDFVFLGINHLGMLCSRSACCWHVYYLLILLRCHYWLTNIVNFWVYSLWKDLYYGNIIGVVTEQISSIFIEASNVFYIIIWIVQFYTFKLSSLF